MYGMFHPVRMGGDFRLGISLHPPFSSINMYLHVIYGVVPLGQRTLLELIGQRSWPTF